MESQYQGFHTPIPRQICFAVTSRKSTGYICYHLSTSWKRMKDWKCIYGENCFCIHWKFLQTPNPNESSLPVQSNREACLKTGASTLTSGSQPSLHSEWVDWQLILGLSCRGRRRQTEVNKCPWYFFSPLLLYSESLWCSTCLSLIGNENLNSTMPLGAEC